MATSSAPCRSSTTWRSTSTSRSPRPSSASSRRPCASSATTSRQRRLHPQLRRAIPRRRAISSSFAESSRQPGDQQTHGQKAADALEPPRRPPPAPGPHPSPQRRPRQRLPPLVPRLHPRPTIRHRRVASHGFSRSPLGAGQVGDYPAGIDGVADVRQGSAEGGAAVGDHWRTPDKSPFGIWYSPFGIWRSKGNVAHDASGAGRTDKYLTPATAESWLTLAIPRPSLKLVVDRQLPGGNGLTFRRGRPTIPVTLAVSFA